MKRLSSSRYSAKNQIHALASTCVRVGQSQSRYRQGGRGGIGDPDYMKGSLSSRHIDLRETATGKPKKDKKPHEKNN